MKRNLVLLLIVVMGMGAFWPLTNAATHHDETLSCDTVVAVEPEEPAVSPQEVLDSAMLVKKARGAASAEFAAALVDVADAYAAIYDYESALDYQRQAVRIYEQLPLDKVGTAYVDALVDLVDKTYLARGENDAIPVALNTKDVMEKNGFKDTEKYYGVLETIVMFYTFTDQDSLSGPYRIERLQVAERLYGKDRVEYLNDLQSLASYYSIENQLDKAVPLQEQVAGRMKEIYGENTIEHVNAMTDLAQMHVNAGHHEQAAGLYAQCVKALDTSELEDYDNDRGMRLFDVLLDQAQCYNQMGDTIRRDEAVNHAMTEAANIFGLNSPGFAMALLKVAETCDKMNDNKKAAFLASSCYNILSNHAAGLEKEQQIEFQLVALVSNVVYSHKTGDSDARDGWIRKLFDMVMQNLAAFEADGAPIDSMLSDLAQLFTREGYPVDVDTLRKFLSQNMK